MEFSDCGSDIENNEEKHDQYILSSMDEERNFKAVCKSFNAQNDQNVMDEKDETSLEKLYTNKFTSVTENQSTVNNEKNKNTAFDPNSKPSNNNKSKSECKIFKTSQGKSPKEEKSEQRPDNIRKRIKVNFSNCYLKKKMNDQLQDPESKKLNLEFSSWSQFFVTNYYKDHNRIFLNQTLRDYILDDSFKKGKKPIPLDFANYENNYKILTYLENKNSNNSEFNITLHMKIKDLFNEYLQSDVYKNYVEDLKNEKDDIYIDIYERIANDFINYYCHSEQ